MKGERETYASIYVFEYTGLIPGYQSIAKYHRKSDMVVVQFVNTANFSDYTWNLPEIAYRRIVKILERQRGAIN